MTNIMPETTVEQMLIGKMAFPQIQGQLSLLTIPRSFEWLTHFRTDEIAEFLTEFLDAAQKSVRCSDIAEINNVIESWKTTANIAANAELAADVQAGLTASAEEESVSWADLRKELQL